MAEIWKIGRMVPDTKLHVAEWARRIGFYIERVGKFRDREHATLADQKVGAARIAHLRVSRSRRRRISVEDSRRQRKTGCRRGAQAHARCRKRIARPAARQVGRQEVWT